MNSRVYTMMPEQDHQDIILIAIMDMMFQHLKVKNQCDTKRLYRLNKLHTALLDYEKQYVGSIPEHVGDKADSLNRLINTGLNMLSKPPTRVVRGSNGRFQRVEG